MGKVIMSGIVPQLSAPDVPIKGLELSTIAEGSIVKLIENGSPVEFYVAQHDYESGLNGAGRTLLVRKDCYDTRVWHSSSVNAYATSDIDAWLNSTYKALLDETVQAAIATTKFYYTPGNGNSTESTLERAVFLLSVPELGLSSGGILYENGTAVSAASVLKIAYLNGTATAQWTRAAGTMNTGAVGFVSTAGKASSGGASGSNIGSRPCFTLPSTAVFDEETLLFTGVA